MEQLESTPKVQAAFSVGAWEARRSSCQSHTGKRLVKAAGGQAGAAGEDRMPASAAWRPRVVLTYTGGLEAPTNRSDDDHVAADGGDMATPAEEQGETTWI